jgi:hypothetical protein
MYFQRFSAKKWRFFLKKKQVLIISSAYTAVIRVKISKFFGENIFEIVAFSPGPM